MRAFHLAAHAALILFTVGFQANQPAKPGPHYAAFPPRTGPQTVLVLRVVDGDTVDFAYLTPERGRLWGCNAHESGTDAGKQAAQALALILKPECIWQCELKGREKYGRQLIDFRMDDGQSVTTWMIGAGHAKPWDGKGQRP